MNHKIKIKVCGMKTTTNREAIEQLPVDYLGFIFYPLSKRYVGDKTDPGLFNSGKEKVAVFVDENIYKIMELAKIFEFRFIQLHGKENPDTCRILQKQGLQVIKAFNVDENFDFASLERYHRSADYFLFDTKSKQPGGSGLKFKWDLLEQYSGQTPFFLSGGIQPDDAEAIGQFKHPRLFGIDLNSGFEDLPGEKNYPKLQNFIERLQKI